MSREKECVLCPDIVGNTRILSCAHFEQYSARKVLGTEYKNYLVYTCDESGVFSRDINRILYVGIDEAEADLAFQTAQERIINEYYRTTGSNN